MKKLIVLSIALCSFMCINAQFRFGVKAGANVSRMNVKQSGIKMDDDNSKRRVGYHFGAMMEYSINDMFAIQPELMYINHGTSFKNLYSLEKARINMNTLQLPVNLKASIGVGKTRLFAYGGPYVSYSMYGKLKGKEDGVRISEELYGKGSDMKRWDYGVGFGVGVEFKNGITLSVGNQIGLGDIDGAKNNRMRIKNETLSIGYFF